MMNRHLFAVVVMALVASCAGCTLGESHADIYGEKCRDWVAVYDNGVSVDFSSASVGDLEAREAGYCPDEFICSLNSEKEKICRRKCDENSYLCNEKCLSTDKYIFSHSKYEGLDYCEATLKCPENCKHGCDESLICKCADGCVNGCDETGACQCDKKCVNGCDETGACQCADDCANGCDETGACKCADGCVNGCDEKGKCTCPETCSTSCDEDGRCQCNAMCPTVCNPNGECLCQKGDAVCLSSTEIKECFDNVWVTSGCPAGCQQGEVEKRDACIPFVCHDDDVQCDSGNEHKIQVCKNNAWQDAQKDCQYGCDNGECLQVESIMISNYKVSLLNDGLENSSENSKDIIIKYIVNMIVTSIDFSIEASNMNCVLVTKKQQDDNSTKLTITVNPEVPSCATTLTLKAGKVEKTVDVRVFGATEDENANHLLDYYETASKQGEDCHKYSDCNSKDGLEKGFCDSFIGYKCSTKCTEDSQCVPDEVKEGNSFHYICRNDGRCAPDTFETVWRTTTPNDSILIHLKNAQECNFDIDWGDGSKAYVESCADDLTHTYSKSGDHHVRIKGTLSGWHTTTAADVLDDNAAKLVEVVSFGTVGFGASIGIYSNVFAFANASNLEKLSDVDIPDASKLASMTGMFNGSTKFNYPIGNWDTSNVKDMSYLFGAASKFNQDIGRWDTSSVTTMMSMFYNAIAFNQDISRWDTSNVTTMHSMFYNAAAFNQDIGNWDTSNVTIMMQLFYGASAFNKNIGSWNTSYVIYMNSMFNGATSFNQDISGWDTSDVRFIAYMFKNATAFNQDISGWKVGKVTSFKNIFCNSGLSDEMKNIIKEQWSKWNTSLDNIFVCD